MTEQFITFFDSNYSIDGFGSIRANSSRRVVDTMKVYQTYASGLMKLGQNSDVTKAEIEEYVSQLFKKQLDDERMAMKNDTTPQNSYEYTSQFLAKVNGKSWRFDPSMRMIERMLNGIPVNSDLNELANAIFVAAIREGKQKRYKQGEIKAALIDIASKASLVSVTNIAKRIAYDASCADKAELFLKTLYDEWKIKQPYEVFRGVFLHVLWQCKRKLLGKPVTWDLILNIFGGSGIGKTSMVQFIGSVFGDFAIVSTLEEVLDTERQVKKLSDCYYINLDELAVGKVVDTKYGSDGSLNSAQKTAFKKLVTQRKARTRNMGGQTQSSQRYTFSFIASSNTHLADVMYDPTTMRRYAEIDCERVGIEDFSKIESIKPYLEDLWKSVDENNDFGYWYPGSPIWHTVEEMQQTYYPSNTTTEAWLRDSGYAPCLASGRIPVMSLYKNYRMFCEEHGNVPKNSEKWKRDIAHIMPSAIVNNLVCLRKVEVETNPPTTSMMDGF